MSDAIHPFTDFAVCVTWLEAMEREKRAHGYEGTATMFRKTHELLRRLEAVINHKPHPDYDPDKTP